MKHLLRKSSLTLLLALAVCYTGISHANVKSVTGRLSLMATVDGKPAFRKVEWRLKRSNPAQLVKTITRHAATVDLEPGSYQISVSLGGKTRTRNITIKESKKHSLTISLD